MVSHEMNSVWVTSFMQMISGLEQVALAALTAQVEQFLLKTS